MDIYSKGLITVLGFSALSIAIALPLALRMIPPNVVYGYRTRYSLSDARVWYEANAFFGRWLVATTAIAAAAVLLLVRGPALHPATFLKVTVAALIAPVLISGIATSRHLRQPGV